MRFLADVWTVNSFCHDPIKPDCKKPLRNFSPISFPWLRAAVCSHSFSLHSGLYLSNIILCPTMKWTSLEVLMSISGCLKQQWFTSIRISFISRKIKITLKFFFLCIKLKQFFTLWGRMNSSQNVVSQKLRKTPYWHSGKYLNGSLLVILAIMEFSSGSLC